MARYNPPSGTKDEKILFIRYSALGDVVRAIPLAATIKEALPEARLTWLLVHPYEELIKGQPYVDDVLVWDRKQGFKGFVRLIIKHPKRRFYAYGFHAGHGQVGRHGLVFGDKKPCRKA
ncbi:MAG: hypothetical protein ABC360_02120 [Acetomicrobium sp.]